MLLANNLTFRIKKILQKNLSSSPVPVIVGAIDSVPVGVELFHETTDARPLIIISIVERHVLLPLSRVHGRLDGVQGFLDCLQVHKIVCLFLALPTTTQGYVFIWVLSDSTHGSVFILVFFYSKYIRLCVCSFRYCLQVHKGM